LSKEEVEKLVREAQEKAQEDQRVRDLAEAKNRAESLVYATEKTLRDLGDKVEANDKTAAEDAIRAVRDALDKNDQGAITKAVAELETVSHKLAEELYKSTQNNDQSSPPPPGGAGGDDVIDADFRPSE
jgi:molecular chaperone DnaK